MKTFLTEVVEDLIARNTDFAHTTMVIPGVRPKSFIRKTFAELGYSGILPVLKTIEELLQDISGLKMVNSVPLLFAAYHSHLETAAEPQTFEDFLKFAPTLLKDFDDIDAALSNDRELLSYMISDERIKHWGVHMDIGLSEVMKNHLGFWTDAQALFYHLRQNLLDDKKAYRGLLARKAAENAEIFIQSSHHTWVFTGFNALTEAEFQIVQIFHKAGKSVNYWDVDKYYLNDEKQEAGAFLRQYKSHFGSDFRFVNDNFIQPKSFKIVNVPRQETQAKFVGNYLSNLAPEERDKTAIVLADEQLLPAVLNALPEEVDKINITMGLPLKLVSVSDFFKHVFNLHLTREKFSKPDLYYYRNVLDILENPNFRNHFQPQLQKLRMYINSRNIIFLPVDAINEYIAENPFFSIFRKPDSPDELLETVIKWIDLLQENVEESAVQQEYLFRFRSIFMQLKDQTAELPYITSFKVLHQLYQQLLQMESVSFIGDPLVGLQLLGMLETRLLDFEHIILTGVNEGVLPLGRKENSYIPFEHRKTFGLNTFLENDAIYAYHFYRLIQRCKSAVFIYNSDNDMASSEPSRFLLQLQLESPHQPQQLIATPDYTKNATEPLEIVKTDKVFEILNEWKNRISPSSLNSYLYDPIQFYERQVLKIKDEEEVEEIAGDRTIGNIVHGVLQLLYEPFLNEILTPQHFLKIESEKDKIFQLVVKEHLKQNSREVEGKNVLILEVAKEMINNVLEKDKLAATENELIIKEVEKEYYKNFTTPGGLEVQFKGYIDRIDSLNGVTRILDYKTGTVKKLNMLSDKLDKMHEHDGSQPLQLAVYAYMSGLDHIESGIYPLRYFSQEIKKLSIDNSEDLTQESILPLMEQIGFLIDEIFDPAIPFSEPEK